MKLTSVLTTLLGLSLTTALPNPIPSVDSTIATAQLINFMSTSNSTHTVIIPSTPTLTSRQSIPTAPICYALGNACQIGYFATANRGGAVVSIWDWYCNRVGYYDNLPYMQVTSLSSQLPLYVVFSIEPWDQAPAFAYGGRLYGGANLDTTHYCWHDLWLDGNPYYCVFYFDCPPA